MQLTCFLLNLAKHAEQCWLHAMAVEGVFPEEKQHFVLRNNRRVAPLN